ncbi:MAG: ribokinase [Cryobacterium sp.]|nr:ribokinase [Cryobacterium sp.]
MLGSANLDLVFSVERIPSPGETVLATSTASHAGGKGLNQAVAAARAGASTTMIGAVADDDAGRVLRAVMHDADIDSRLVRLSSEPTGQAMIAVDPSAENSIIVAAGANATLTSLTDADRAAIRSAAVLLMQLEVPIATVTDAALAARESGVVVMLNAAPANELPDELLASLDYLIVNEHEASVVSGIDDLARATEELATRVGRLVVTLGSDGCELWEGGTLAAKLPARRVTAVDTTGAGDTFCGAFAAAIAEGADYEAAGHFATVAASLSVQSHGAVPSIPLRADIEAVLGA